MQQEKHLESIRETLREIESALKDPAGLASHQRRLALMTSIGIAELVELYFHKLEIIKPGVKIEHQWFQRKLDNVKEKIGGLIIKPLNLVRGLDKLLELAIELESNRNLLAYGSPVKDEKILLGRINKFLEFKKLIEAEVKEELK